MARLREVMTSERLRILLITLLIGVVSVPLLINQYPPLVDYPLHLARSSILFHYEDSPFFQKFYEPDWRPLPNVGVDYVLYVLQLAFTTATAGRLFLVSTAVLFVIGLFSLSRQLVDRDAIAAPAAASLLLYNSTFLYGFINYNFGLALFFCTFALWLKWKERFTALRLAILTILSVLCYLSHLTSVACLGVAVAVTIFYEMYFGGKSLAFGFRGLLPFVAPGALVLFFMTGAAPKDVIQFSSLKEKLIALSSWFRTYSVLSDAVVLLGLGVGSLLVLIFDKRQRRGDFKHPAALIALAFVVLFAVLPRAMISAYAVDARLVIPALVFVLLAFEKNFPALAAKILLGIAVSVLLFRIVAIQYHWVKLQPRISAGIELLNLLPENSRVFPIAKLDQPDADSAKQVIVLHHISNYATLTRGARVATLLAIRGQQPLVSRKPTSDVSSVGEKFVAQLRPEDFSHIWVAGPVPSEVSTDPRLQLIGRTADFSLWKFRDVRNEAIR